MQASSQTTKATTILKGPIVSTFYSYAMPWMLGMLLISSAGIVDGLFIGRYVGALALAALNIVIPVFTLISGLGIMLASGSAVRCGWYRGRGEEHLAKAVFTKCILLTTAASLGFSLLCWPFALQIVYFLGADATLAPIAASYLRIVVIFFVPFTLSYALGYFIRLDERPVLVSVGFMGSALCNIILDYLFIAHWGFDITGAAWATGISYTLLFIMLVGTHFIWNKNPHLRFVRQWGSWYEMGQAAWNGASEMVNELSAGTIIFFVNIIMMQRVGPYGVAAFTVINYVNWLCIMVAYGFSDSLGPFVSVNKGAQQLRRARNFAIVAALTVGGTGLFFFLLLTFFPEAMIGLFLQSDSLAREVALDFMYLSRFMLLVGGLNIVLTAYLTGLLFSAASAIMALSRGIILPIVLLLTLPPLLGNTGVYIALPVAEFLTLLLGIWFVYKYTLSS